MPRRNACRCLTGRYCPAALSCTPRTAHGAIPSGPLTNNVYKMVVALLAVEIRKAGAGSAAWRLVSAVFILPFLLFSGYAGHAADVLSKRTVLVVTKSFEVLVMGLACGALLSGRLDYMLSVLFLLATQATFFGPAKYGLLPELLRQGFGPRQWTYRDEQLCRHHSGDGPRHGHVRSLGQAA